jgi:hypothetical protein
MHTRSPYPLEISQHSTGKGTWMIVQSLQAIKLRLRFETGLLKHVTRVACQAGFFKNFLIEGVKTTAHAHPDRPVRLHNLASHLGKRSLVKGDRHDLAQAIEYAKEATKAIPADHFHRARFFFLPGNTCRT